LFEITKTDEWNDILRLCYSEAAKKKDRVVDLAGSPDHDIKKIWGQYDGYRQAVDFLKNLGGK